jgi:hypothetical protein
VKPQFKDFRIKIIPDNSIEMSGYGAFDQLLFRLFAKSVAKENKSLKIPNNYRDLITMISTMTVMDKPAIVHNKGKNILIKLFPPFLLPLYKLSFAKFPTFSAVMNTWVTHKTTAWLMGNSTIIDLELPNGNMAKNQCLYIPKCSFLEESGCLRTCIHACKIPTQRFFLEEMDLRVTLKPNLTDLSCRFEFGIHPLPLEQDEITKMPCLTICKSPNSKQMAINNKISSCADGVNL